MTDMYLLAVVRMKELRREAELARRGTPVAPRAGRSRIMLAQWLMAMAARLSPEVARNAMGGAR